MLKLQFSIDPVLVNGQSMISFTGPYSTVNNSAFRLLQGKFSAGKWLIPDTPRAREVLAESFGAKSEAVEVLVYAPLLSDDEIVQYGGYVLVERRGRDQQPKLKEGVGLDRGQFARQGGSVKNPKVGLTNEMVFRLTCRKAFAEARQLQPALVPSSANVIEI